MRHSMIVRRLRLAPLPALLVGIATIALVVGPGCFGATHNRPPTARLESNVTEGVAPLQIQWTPHVTDPDGDRLLVSLHNEREGGGGGTAEMPPRRGGTNETLAATTTFYAPGVFTYTLMVSDGEFQATDSVVIRVTGEIAYNLEMDARSNLTASCPMCSGGMVGTPAALGGEGCQGLLTGANATDCLWYELRPEWEGKLFEANGTDGADLDLEMRTSCDPGVGRRLALYLNDGVEREDIPVGGRCAVLWAWDQAPASVRFRV